MQGLQIELCFCLRLRETHGGPGYCLGNCLRVDQVGLVGFDEGFDELRGNYPDFVPGDGRLLREPVATRTSLHADNCG
jgi:hypothetical protein